MLLTRKKTQPASVVLNDLVMINNERIACYRQAITQAKDSDLKNLFEEIVIEAQGFKEELIEQLQQLNTNARDNITISGMIHSAWQDLRATFTGTSRNATISYCLYNEEIARQTYDAALNLSGEVTYEIQAIIERQHSLLNERYNLVKKHKEIPHYPAVRLMYFN